MVAGGFSENILDLESGSGEAAGDAALADAAVHCSGSLAADAGGTRQRFEHALLRGGCAHAALAAALYAGFDAVGLQYGPGYRTLERVWGCGGGAAVAVARLAWSGWRASGRRRPSAFLVSSVQFDAIASR